MKEFMRRLIFYFVFVSMFNAICNEKNEALEKYKAGLYKEIGHTEAELKAMDDVKETEEKLQAMIEAKTEEAINNKFNPEKLKEVEASAASKYKLYKVGDRFKGISGGRSVTGTIHQITKNRVRCGDHLLVRSDYPSFYFDPIENARLRKAYIEKLYHSKRKPYEIKAKRYFTDKLMSEAGYLKIRGIWRSPKEIIANIEKRCKEWLEQ